MKSPSPDVTQDPRWARIVARDTAAPCCERRLRKSRRLRRLRSSGKTSRRRPCGSRCSQPSAIGCRRSRMASHISRSYHPPALQRRAPARAIATECRDLRPSGLSWRPTAGAGGRADAVSRPACDRSEPFGEVRERPLLQRTTDSNGGRLPTLAAATSVPESCRWCAGQFMRPQPMPLGNSHAF